MINETPLLAFEVVCQLNGPEKRCFCPQAVAMDCISASSVDTSTCSNKPDACTASIAYAIIGLPAKALMFLRGMRLLPPRAGMTAMFMMRVVLLVIQDLKLQMY